MFIFEIPGTLFFVPFHEVATLTPEWKGRWRVVLKDGTQGTIPHQPSATALVSLGSSLVNPAHLKRMPDRQWQDPAGYLYPPAELPAIPPAEPEPAIPELPCGREQVIGAHSSDNAKTCTWETDLGDFVWKRTVQKSVPLHPDLLEAKPGHYINRKRLRRVRRDGNFFSLILDNGRTFVKLHEPKHYALAEKLGLPHFFHLEPHIDAMHTYRLQDYPLELATAGTARLRAWFPSPRNLIANLLFQAVRYRQGGTSPAYGTDLRAFWMEPVSGTLLRAGFMTATEHRRWSRPNYQGGPKDTLWDLYRKMVAELVGEERLFNAQDIGFTVQDENQAQPGP